MAAGWYLVRMVRGGKARKCKEMRGGKEMRGKARQGKERKKARKQERKDKSRFLLDFRSLYNQYTHYLAKKTEFPPSSHIKSRDRESQRSGRIEDVLVRNTGISMAGGGGPGGGGVGG